MPVTDAVQFYYNYDKSFVDWVRQVKYQSRPILCVFASPDRAFGQLRHVIKEKTNKDPGVTPLPFASISRIGAELDLYRYNPAVMKKMYYSPQATDTMGTRVYHGTKMAQPMILTYQLDIWARDLHDLDNLTAQVILGFNGKDAYLTVAHPLPWGDRLVLMTYEGFIERSDLEPQENKRVLRRAFTFKTNAWLSHPQQDTNIITDGSIEIWESSDLETLEVLLDTVVLEE
jgi:hypothetical protein